MQLVVILSSRPLVASGRAPSAEETEFWYPDELAAESLDADMIKFRVSRISLHSYIFPYSTNSDPSMVGII